MNTESYDGVAVLGNETHAVVARLSYGITGHVVALDVTLDDGSTITARRTLTARGRRPMLRGTPISARARDEHERSFDLFVDNGIVGNVRLGQRVILEGETVREGRAFGLVKAAA